MHGLTPSNCVELTIRQVLDTRLAKTSDKPIVLGLSGGGDSVALALVTSRWARDHNRPLHFITIDHGLNSDSARWGDTCAALAARLRVGFRQLVWRGDKPLTGIPAAARVARHGLLAEAARDLGATVILIGHTADDCTEAEVMRQTGSTTPNPTEWSPSPAWPAGRGVHLLRPMLDIRRADLREFLVARGEVWIEDPANDSLLFARSRARLDLTKNPAPIAIRRSPKDLTTLSRKVRFQGEFVLARQSLREASREVARALVGRACVCAGGGSRPAKGARLDRLTKALLGSEDLVATLVGCRVEADLEQIRWARNSGEIRRGGRGSLAIEGGVASIWDGRFEIVSDRSVRISQLAGHGSKLSSAAQTALKSLPTAARPSLPIVMDQQVIAPSIEDVPGIKVSDLTWERFQAACGEFQAERD